ncbi:hypothetical protein LXL04_034175 [Taraxacum kok-saghyz]
MVLELCILLQTNLNDFLGVDRLSQVGCHNKMDKYKIGMRVEIVGHSDGFWNSYYGAKKNLAPGHPLLRPTPRHPRLNPSSQQRPFLTARSQPPRLRLPVRPPGTTAVQVLSFLAQPTSCLPYPRFLQERQNSNQTLTLVLPVYSSTTSEIERNGRREGWSKGPHRQLRIRCAGVFFLRAVATDDLLQRLWKRCFSKVINIACFLSFSGGVGLFCILEFKEKRESLTDGEHLLLRFHTEYSESKCFDFTVSISDFTVSISDFRHSVSASILSIQVLIFSQGASRISHRHSDFRNSATSILHSQSVTPISHRHSDFRFLKLPVSKSDFTSEQIRRAEA